MILLKQSFYDLVISINVHENLPFLVKQLDNIDTFVKMKYIVILNCNKTMYELISKENLPYNIILNPKYFDKKRFHGTLAKGIYSNLVYSLHNFKFDFFLVLSSRTFFYNKLVKKNLLFLDKRNIIIGQNSYVTRTRDKWFHWHKMFKTKLSDKISFLNGKYSHCPHEGLIFSKEQCYVIYNYLKKYSNKKIKEEIFNFTGCMEEFVFQTIISTFGNNKIYNIGNGFRTIPNKDIIKLPKYKYVYKRDRIC